MIIRVTHHYVEATNENHSVTLIPMNFGIVVHTFF